MDRSASKLNRPSQNAEGCSRRQFLGGVALGGASLGSFYVDGSQVFAQPPKTDKKSRAGLLVRPTDVNVLNTRVKIVLELDGQLRIDEPNPEKEDKPREADVKGKSTLDYFEKVALDGTTPIAAARQHLEAGVENWISGSAATYQLRPECYETQMMMHRGQWQAFCKNETLDAREVELLHSPINSAAVELLLPKEPAKPDSTWSISAEDARHLFNLDAVHSSTLQARTVKVEKGVASLEIKGVLEATANSVPTRLKINGNFRAKLASQCALVTWVGIVIEEERDISQAEPGFTITARVRLLRDEAAHSFACTDDELLQLPATEDPGRWLVRLQSTTGRYEMLADRRWRVYLDSGEDATLRMIENNTVIAQCSISRLAPLDDGQQLTLEGLQSDIRKSLGDGFGEFLESSEKLTSAKLRLLRVVVAGELEGIPIQWIYDHLSDDSGRRMAMIFTMGGNVTDIFAAADEQLTSSFTLLPEASPTDNQPVAAPKLTAETKASSSKR
jgi:hypothetical protein